MERERDERRAERQLRLPLRLGGFGLVEETVTSIAGFVSSWASTLHELIDTVPTQGQAFAAALKAFQKGPTPFVV